MILQPCAPAPSSLPQSAILLKYCKLCSSYRNALCAYRTSLRPSSPSQSTRALGEHIYHQVKPLARSAPSLCIPKELHASDDWHYLRKSRFLPSPVTATICSETTRTCLSRSLLCTQIDPPLPVLAPTGILSNHTKHGGRLPAVGEAASERCTTLHFRYLTVTAYVCAGTPATEIRFC